jgi:glycogen debranching enzyme
VTVSSEEVARGKPAPDVYLEAARRLGVDAPRAVAVEVLLDADFADIFDIRGMRTGTRSEHVAVDVSASDGGLRFHDGGTGLQTLVRLDPPPESLEGGLATWAPVLTRGLPWTLRILVEARPDAVADRGPPAALAEEARSTTTVTSDPPDLGRGCERALTDLRALSMPDRMAPGRTLLAAGIPWFVALFGRDSLITGIQARAFRPRQMMDTLMGLAARQGTVSDPGNEEEPGKILHEVRLTPRPWLGEGTDSDARPYYGTIDATPLFLILYGTARRWGASRDALTALLPAARAALGWMRGAGDPDGDGLLEYRARGGRSLGNQGWKDSVDAVQFPDGRLARGPIAMVEVQGYAHRARRELAGVLRHLGHDDEA